MHEILNGELTKFKQFGYAKDIFNNLLSTWFLKYSQNMFVLASKS